MKGRLVFPVSKISCLVLFVLKLFIKFPNERDMIDGHAAIIENFYLIQVDSSVLFCWYILE